MTHHTFYRMNREEAERCIRIAKKCISEGNREKAEKFLNKSLNLHETAEAKGGLLSYFRSK